MRVYYASRVRDLHRSDWKGLEIALRVPKAYRVWAEEPIQARARGRHGLVSRDELLAMGVSDHEIVRRLGTGRLHKQHPGVYYLDSVLATWKTAVLAAVLAAGPGALASHRTAAVLWQMDAIYGRMLELTVPFNEEPVPQGVILHRTRRANPGVGVDGIPVTSPEKTLLDLARILPERALQKAARSAVSNAITDPLKMDDAVRLYGGRGVAGTRKYRRVVALVADDQSGSAAEIDLNHIVMDAPVPRPVQQLQIRLPEGNNAYPDFAWPDRMRIVEADGFEAHSTPEQLRHDLSRQNQLMDLGWEMRRFTASDIRDRPAEVREEVIRFVNKPFCAD